MISESQNTPTLAFICLLSSQSAIGDSFVDLVNNLSAELKRNCLIIKSTTYHDNLFDISSDRILNLSINRKNLGIQGWRNFFSSLKLVSKQHLISQTIIYGISPLNHLASLFLPSRERIIWVHDVHPHPGAHISEKISCSIVKKFAQFRITSKFLVSNNHLKSELAKAINGLEITIYTVRFPYISSIVHAEGSTSQNGGDILFFGRVEPYKGVNLLIAALSDLKKKGISYTTIIAGKGKEDSFPEDLNIQRINNYVSNIELHALIKNSEICIFPYVSATGTQAIQTALAIGTKCLVSNLPPFIEIAEQVDYKGITVFSSPTNLAECIQKSIADKNLSKLDIAKTAREAFSQTSFGLHISCLEVNHEE